MPVLWSSRHVRAGALLAVLAAAVACAARAPESPHQHGPDASGRPGAPGVAEPATHDVRRRDVRLDLVAVRVLATGASLPGDQGYRVGGLSGCALDGTSGRVTVVSDDRDQPRAFMLDLHLENGRLEVGVSDVVRLADRDNDAPDRRVIDMEGIAGVGPGEWAISAEGLLDHSVPVPPAIARYSGGGALTGWLDIPEAFLPGAPDEPARGVHANQALESLTRTPDGRLITAAEGPLKQDDAIPGFDESARVRLLEYVAAGTTWRPARQFAYDLAPVSRPADFGPSTLSTGISELFALDDDRLLVLERSYVAERGGTRRGRNVVRIFEVSLRGGDDVSSLASLRDRTVRPLGKRLVLDLDEIETQLRDVLPTLENFEAMCNGPRLADGAPSLLLISDDNFSRRQQTAFLLFRVRGTVEP